MEPDGSRIKIVRVRGLAAAAAITLTCMYWLLLGVLHPLPRCNASVGIARYLTSPLFLFFFFIQLELSNLQKLKKSNRPDGTVTLLFHLNFYLFIIPYIPSISSFSAFMDFRFFSSLIFLRKPLLYKTHTEF